MLILLENTGKLLKYEGLCDFHRCGSKRCLLVYAQIPIVSPAEASTLALKYRKQGFETLKLKVGKNLKADIEVLQAIRAVHPTCSFILDANEGYKTEEAVEVFEKLHGKKVYESFVDLLF